MAGATGELGSWDLDPLKLQRCLWLEREPARVQIPAALLTGGAAWPRPATPPPHRLLEWWGVGAVTSCPGAPAALGVHVLLRLGRR